MLQAAQYGVPSSRPRFILWASLPAFELPAFPQPQNISPRSFHLGIMNTSFVKRRAAPHHTLTAGDAMTDLQLWEWQNHNSYPPAAGREGITQHVVLPMVPFTGHNVQLYESEPRTEFQRRMRKGATANVYGHVTHCARPHVERICNLPARPDADHKDLPERLQTATMLNGTYDSPQERRYQRLNMDQTFQACLTTLNPMGKKSRVSE